MLRTPCTTAGHLWWGLLFLAALPTWAVYNAGSGVSEDPYQISDPCQMVEIGQHPEHWTSYFVLTADIDMAGCDGSQYCVIGNSSQRFTGSFNGRGHSIFNFACTTTGSARYVGLFGQLGSGAEIRDLGLENVQVDLEAASVVGALAGFSWRGSIINCYASGNINAGANSASIGGLVGLDNQGAIKDCWAACAIGVGDHSTSIGGLVGYNSLADINDCHSTAAVSSEDYSSSVGALVGYNASGRIHRCRAAGVVTGGTGSENCGGLAGYSEAGKIHSCQATVEVTGTSSLGGLVGYKNGGSISDSFASGNTIGNDRLGGLVGRNDVGTVDNSYATGDVNGVDALGGLLGRNHKGSVQDCYSAGHVTGSTRTGGLVGNDDRGSYAACFWQSSANPGLSGAGDADPDPSGIMSRTQEEMLVRSIFTGYGWDFLGEDENGIEDIWRMCVNGIHYPRLSYEHVRTDIVCPDGVGFDDVRYLTGYWLQEDCWEIPRCSRVDWNSDGAIDMRDFAHAVEDWLCQ